MMRANNHPHESKKSHKSGESRFRQRKVQWLAYSLDSASFVRDCVYIYDATGQDWVKFDLWPAQAETLAAMASSRKLVILKARQLGISWLCLSYALWLMLFQAPAFSARSGRSYTGTLAIMDEADFVPELSQFLNAVKPTIDAGGQLFLVSTADKKRPVSTFKNLFRAAVEGADGSTVGGDYRHVFSPWWARPERDATWRAAVQAEMFAQRGTNDDLYAEYPASAEEALAAEQLDRRLPWEWVKRCVDTSWKWGTSWRYPHLLEVYRQIV